MTLLGRSLARAVALVAIAMACSPAVAAGRFEAGSDILGLALSLSQDQAKELVHAKFKDSPFALIPVHIVIGDYTATVVAGFMFDAARDKPDIGNVDRVAVFFNPKVGSSDIIAVTRTIQFVSKVDFDDPSHPNVTGTKVEKQIVIDSLIGKYGPPTRIVPQPNRSTLRYVWSLNKDAAQRSECLPSENSDYYYTPPYLVQSVDEEAAERSDGLISAMNNLGNKLLVSQASCGIVLSIELDLDDFSAAGSSGDLPYVTNMKAELVDLSRTSLELQSFIGDVSAAANKMNNAASGQPQSAPKL